MRILLLADLHSVRCWYEWVTAQASKYDLVSIAGDLTDAFATDEARQVAYLFDEWLPSFRMTAVPLAICSGNHDDAKIRWAAGDAPGFVVGDGETRLLTLHSRRLIVTTCPNNQWGDDPPLIGPWEEAARLRDREKCPWLVLHHEPPRDLLPPGYLTGTWLNERLAEHRPDYVTCGHLHITGDLSFAMKVGSTWCFNAGQWMGAPRPHHIVLDLAARTATRHRMLRLWRTLSWVPKSDTITL